MTCDGTKAWLQDEHGAYVEAWLATAVALTMDRKGSACPGEQLEYSRKGTDSHDFSRDGRIDR
jgi:hypothetical protein